MLRHSLARAVKIYIFFLTGVNQVFIEIDDAFCRAKAAEAAAATEFEGFLTQPIHSDTDWSSLSHGSFYLQV